MVRERVKVKWVVKLKKQIGCVVTYDCNTFILGEGCSECRPGCPCPNWKAWWVTVDIFADFTLANHKNFIWRVEKQPLCQCVLIYCNLACIHLIQKIGLCFASKDRNCKHPDHFWPNPCCFFLSQNNQVWAILDNFLNAWDPWYLKLI